jgi:phosphotransferase system enzyme I (PtsI)
VTRARETAVLEGVAASPGIAVGCARVLERAPLVLPDRRVSEEEVPGEVERLVRGAACARERLAAARRRVSGLELGSTILQTQILILEDRQLIEGAARRIREQRVNAEQALRAEGERFGALFEAMTDPYLRERRADIDFALREILMSLLGCEPEGVGPLEGPTVVVAADLSPAETAQLDRSRVVAFATDAGGRTSHAVILAHSLGLPAVVGLGSVTRTAREGDLVIVDGRAGRVLVRPGPSLVRAYSERACLEARRERALLRLAALPAETRDGRPIELRANIEQVEEAAAARPLGARGVGLFRTEFLFLNRDQPPGEEEQLRHYREVLAAVAPDPAAIRSVDLGADKLPLVGLRRVENNPALGLRGVRLARGHSALYRTQFRALLRASPAGRLRILLPLVTGLDEVRAARAWLADLQAELEAEGRPVAPGVELGVVVETPAAVSLVDVLAGEVDFFSIGTNDLIQYTVAVDRENESVGYLYDAGHPAVLRAIRAVVDRAHQAGRPVGVCGEMAGDPLYTLVLAGLGVDELSMNAASIPRVKRIVRQTDQPEARSLAMELLSLGTTAEVADHLRKEMRRRFPEEFEPQPVVP